MRPHPNSSERRHLLLCPSVARTQLVEVVHGFPREGAATRDRCTPRQQGGPACREATQAFEAIITVRAPYCRHYGDNCFHKSTRHNGHLVKASGAASPSRARRSSGRTNTVRSRTGLYSARARWTALDREGHETKVFGGALLSYRARRDDQQRVHGTESGGMRRAGWAGGAATERAERDRTCGARQVRHAAGARRRPSLLTCARRSRVTREDALSRGAKPGLAAGRRAGRAGRALFGASAASRAPRARPRRRPRSAAQ